MCSESVKKVRIKVMFTVSNPFVTKKSKIETIKNNTETKVKITCTTNALHYRKLLLGSFHEMAVSLVHIY